MRRALIVAAVAATSLLAPGAAMAQDTESIVPPEFSPPAPAPVVDVASAEAFAERYAARNAGRFLDQNRRRVRVFDVEARCLEHPVVADRFGCVFTLRAAVILRRSRGWWGWDGHDKAEPARAAGGNRGRRFRIRNYGCLGLLRIQGGPTVEPTVQVPLIDCVRVPRGDYDAPEPAPTR
jgi:hypothetical protein